MWELCRCLQQIWWTNSNVLKVQAQSAPKLSSVQIVSGNSLMPGSKEAIACWNWALSPDCAAS